MIAYNGIGRAIFVPERPLEPPDDYEEETGEEEETPDWVNDEEHSYVLKGGKIYRYEQRKST